MGARFGGQSKNHHIADSFPPTRREDLRNTRGPKKSRDPSPWISSVTPPREAQIRVPSGFEQRKVEGRLREQGDPNDLAPLRNLQAPIDEPENLKPAEKSPRAFLRHGEHERPFP
jgi:hypothetical protein